MIPMAYLNGKPISLPDHDPETESVDICSGCSRTFVVGRGWKALKESCTTTPCPMKRTTE